MKLLAIKMKLVEIIKTCHITAIITVIILLIGSIWATAQIAYWSGVAHGVTITEQCSDHWGKMANEGRNYYCMD